MSIRNRRTLRHEDDFADALASGQATLADAMAHAQEILVEVPEAWGQANSDCVAALLEAIIQSNHALDVPMGTPVRELLEWHSER